MRTLLFSTLAVISTGCTNCTLDVVDSATILTVMDLPEGDVSIEVVHDRAVVFSCDDANWDVCRPSATDTVTVPFQGAEGPVFVTVWVDDEVMFEDEVPIDTTPSGGSSCSTSHEGRATVSVAPEET